MRLSCTVAASVLLLLMSVTGRAADEEKPPSIGDLLQQADVALRRGAYKDAISATSKVIKQRPDEPRAYVLRAMAYEGAKDYARSIADFDRVIKLDPKTALSRAIRADDRRGDAKLKHGDMKGAVADFDAFLKRVPEAEPYHWRRGIAFYYAKQFKRGVAQFESHKDVNGSDVENSVWHFLCNAQLVGTDKARDALIPLKGPDGRVPMMKVFDLFAGKATPADVLKAAESADGSVRQSEAAMFYAHLYLGLYHEAMGKAGLAKKHMRLAATKHTSPYYMGDVARVHVRLRKWDKREEGAKKP